MAEPKKDIDTGDQAQAPVKEDPWGVGTGLFQQWNALVGNAQSLEDGFHVTGDQQTGVNNSTTSGQSEQNIKLDGSQIAGYPRSINGAPRDGYSDAIGFRLPEVLNLPTGARAEFLRDMADRFSNPRSPAEKLAAAQALIAATKDADGKVPAVLAVREVFVPEVKRTVGGGRSFRTDVTPAHNENRALKSADVLAFLNNPDSAAALITKTQSLLDSATPKDEAERQKLDQERARYINRLAKLFDSSDENSPEKLAAAQGLKDLLQNANGQLPDSVGSYTVRHPETKVRIGGGNQARTETKPAWDEPISVKANKLTEFLNRHSDGMLQTTSDLLESTDKDRGQKVQQHIASAVETFRTSTNTEDKVAAAATLLDLTRREDGGHPDTLGSRMVQTYIRTDTSSKGARKDIYEPRQDNVRLNEVVDFLKQRSQTSSADNSRLIAADALTRDGRMSGETHQKLMQAILQDPLAPESLKEHIRVGTNQNQEESALRSQVSDGRVVVAEKPAPADSVPIQEAEKNRVRLILDTFTQSIGIPADSKSVKEMHAELDSGKFGPASRELYNLALQRENATITALAMGTASRNLPWPDSGAPIEPPTDASGRKMSDAQLREEILAGRITKDMKLLAPGESPDKAALDAFQAADTSRIGMQTDLNAGNTRWQVSTFDEAIRGFNHNGRLDSLMSKEGMSLQEMERFQAQRVETLGLMLAVKNYAHTIASYNKATSDKNSGLRWLRSSAESTVFPDEALRDGIFPGHVERDADGRISDFKLDLPSKLDAKGNLDLTDPENMAKINAYKTWLETYAPMVDQATNEIAQAQIKDGRMLMWGSLPAHGEKDGKEFNTVDLSFSADKVHVKVDDGKGGTKEEERIRVVSSKQLLWKSGFSYCGVDLATQEVGKPVRSGACLVNGEPVDLNDRGVIVGTKGAIRTGSKADGVSEQHAEVRISPDGKFYVRDHNSEQGTFVNGKRIGSDKWVEVDPTKDKVTLGQKEQLSFESDVRLYKPNDSVSVLIDGKMQTMLAKDLDRWAFHAKAWHYGGKVVTAAMDIGMLVTGTIELKAAWAAVAKGAATFAAQQAGKQVAEMSAKELGKYLTGMSATQILKTGLTKQALHTFEHGVVHLGFGATGIAHQAIENMGPSGQMFNQVRGYAMMLDIGWQSLAKPALGWAGLAKAESQVLNEFLATAPTAAKVMNVTGKGFLAANGYFIPEIVTRQFPGIWDSMQGDNPDLHYARGVQQRAGKYDSSSATVFGAAREQILPFQTAQTQEKVEVERAKAQDMASKPEAEKEKYAEQLAARYLGAQTTDDRLVAALALLELRKDVPGDVLASRYKHKDALPDSVHRSDIERFMAYATPSTFGLLDGQLRPQINAAMEQVNKLLALPADNPERKAATETLLRTFNSATSESQKLTAALSLSALATTNGTLAETVGSFATSDGTQVTVKGADVNNFLKSYNQKVNDRAFSHYIEALQQDSPEKALKDCRMVYVSGNRSRAAHFELRTDTTSPIAHAKAAREATDPKSRDANLFSLIHTYRTSKNTSEKAAAAVSLIMLGRNADNGALPLNLGASRYSNGIDTRSVIGYLQRNASQLSVSGRMAVSDMLYRMGQPPLGGHNMMTDLSGSLLSVLNDPKATPEQKRLALLNPDNPGLGELLEIQRYQIEPKVQDLSNGDPSKLFMQAALSGRDSKAIETALKSTWSNPKEDADIRALAGRLLLAANERTPEQRAAALKEVRADYDTMSGHKGAFANQFMLEQKDVLLNPPKTDTDRWKLLRAAQLFGEGNVLGENELTKEQLAHAYLQSFNANVPSLAHEVLSPLLNNFKDLNETDKQQALIKVMGLVPRSASATNSTLNLLRQEVISRLPELSAAAGRDAVVNGFKFGNLQVRGAAETLVATLTPGRPENKGTTPEIRAAAARALGELGVDDPKAISALKNALGLAGATADESPAVRAQAIDALAKLNVPSLRQDAIALLGTERDAEVLRHIKAVERGERRADPDSKQYKDDFRTSQYRLLAHTKEQTGLADCSAYLNANYPLLNGKALYDQYHNEQLNVRNGFFSAFGTDFSTQTGLDVEKRQIENKSVDEMFRQLDRLGEAAKQPTKDGDLARRSLAWIVMSNGQSVGMGQNQAVVERAARRLDTLCRTGNPDVRNATAPLILMGLATQDRMPLGARHSLLNGLQALKPGEPGSPISREDAGTALLSALKLQMNNYTREGNTLNYQASHSMQLRLLDAYSKFASTDAIPMMEAISQQAPVGKMERTEAGVKVTYPDHSSRELAQDASGRVWKETVTNTDGKTTVRIREGSSDVWFDANDKEKKNPWRGDIQLNIHTGDATQIDAYGNKTTYTMHGATVAQQKNGTKVTYPDGSSRELITTSNGMRKDTFVDSQGKRLVWVNDSKTNNWYRETDTQKKRAWSGTRNFDAATGDFVTRMSIGNEWAKWTSRTKPTGSEVRAFDGERANYATPAMNDTSYHSMPLIRERANELLANLRDNTTSLQEHSITTTTVPPAKLAQNLERILANRDATSDDVVRAIYSAGMSQPPQAANDPRTALFKQLANDPHERIQVAAAKMLFQSADAADRKTAAGILAEIAKNGTRLGYRQDAQSLIDDVKSNASRYKEGDKSLVESAMAQTVEKSKLLASAGQDTPVDSDARTVEYQDNYEEMRARLLTDSMRSLGKLREQKWWQDNGYGLLHQVSYEKDGIGAAEKEAAPGFFGRHFSFQDTIDKNYAKARKDVDVQYDGQWKRLIETAYQNSPKGKDARDALSYILLSNGAPLRPELRAEATAKAAETLAKIFSESGPTAHDVEWVVKSAVISNPGLTMQARATLSEAVYQRAIKGKAEGTTGGTMTKPEAAVILTAALEAEFAVMPGARQPGFEQSTDYQMKLLNRLGSLNDKLSEPVLKAIAGSHPYKPLQLMAEQQLERIRRSNPTAQ